MFGKSIKSGLAIVCALFVVSVFAGCRGDVSRKPPVHLNPNMDTQDKFKAYRKSTFFADGRTMRPPPLGTVARGKLKADTKLHCGKANRRLREQGRCGIHRGNANRADNGGHGTRTGQIQYLLRSLSCERRFLTGKFAFAPPMNGQMAIKPPTFHSKRQARYPWANLSPSPMALRVVQCRAIDIS